MHVLEKSIYDLAMHLDELSKIVQNATVQGRPGLYRTLYGVPAALRSARIDSWDDWHGLPLLRREFIEKIPFAERLFIPLTDVDSIRATSGTSGKPPLFVPRAFETRTELVAYNLEYHSFSRATLTTGPLHRYAQILHQDDTPHAVIALDPSHIEDSVALAKAAGIDSLMVMTSILPLLVPALVAAGIAEDLRYIETYGEPCSETTVRYLIANFPNATLMSDYGQSEVGGTSGYLCRPITATQHVEEFHPSPGVFLELCDHETGKHVATETGAVGELIATCATGSVRAMPMIRYATGDIAEVTASDCEKHGTWKFRVIGRTELDLVKIPGGMLQTAEILRVLKSIPHRVSDEFEAHLETTSDKPVRLVIHVSPLRDDDLTAITQIVSDSLHVSPTLTYSMGVLRGIYEPLECVVLRRGDTISKRRGIVRD
jgi:phenylacetate-coenzyme A ligase PaaK-like adenylate-forming protein